MKVTYWYQMIEGSIYYITYDGMPVYTGATTKTLEVRWDRHQKDSSNKNGPIYQFMMEKGRYSDKFKIHLIEILEAESKNELEEYEGSWQKLLKDNGFPLKNGKQAGNGGSGEYGSRAYYDKQARQRTRVQCIDCPRPFSWGDHAWHRKRYGCGKTPFPS